MLDLTHNDDDGDDDSDDNGDHNDDTLCSFGPASELLVASLVYSLMACVREIGSPVGPLDLLLLLGLALVEPVN